MHYSNCIFTKLNTNSFIKIQLFKDKYYNNMSENVYIELVEEKEPLIQITTEFMLTRYLYIRQDVELSLIQSILDKDLNQSLFWAYELYYSGFESEVLYLLSQIYDTYYAYLNPKLGQFLNKQGILWSEKKENDWIIGIIVRNMVIRPHSTHKICDTECPKLIAEKRIFVMMAEKDIIEYKTVDDDKYEPRLILRNVCKYSPSGKSLISLFINQTAEIKNTNNFDKWANDWLYYAAFSPIWKDRLDDYGGEQNHITKTVEFPDDENYEGFYESFGYEPDEQPISLKSRPLFIVSSM